MLLVPCMNCFTSVRVMGDPAEVNSLVGQASDFWPNKYTCVTCNAPCEAIVESDADPNALRKMKVRELSAQELFAALNGLGTPDEMICDASTVREVFTRPIKKVHGNTVANTSRFLIEAIEFEDGTKIHLGASSHGALVYRITRPVSYTKSVLENG